MRKLIFLALSLLLLALASGCGTKADAATDVQSGEVKVTMKNMKFTPAKLTIKKGTKVTFINQDAIIHDAVQIDMKDWGKAEPGFDSKEVMPGKSFTVTFDKAGEYPIICTQAAHFTAGMIGSITVVE
ncbi:MAG TPA: plastocyanin/azurin family copper-binding protein [Symbiobacteriaceae bacterium]|nr:plastocyanin/azurin family copper-binding protein [Symbiobacteriaceae bacterium]